MKRFALMLLVVVPVLWAAPVIDGTITPSDGWVLVGTSQYPTGGGVGANLDKFYYYRDDTYLYLAFSTLNTQSWNTAYGIALDPGDAFGYVGVPGVDQDAWNRYITFDNPPSVNWEFYWYWDATTGAITAFDACQWTGSGWIYQDLGIFAYSSSSGTGVEQLEYRVAWTDLEFTTPPDAICLAIWIAGLENSSAVDVIPQDPTVVDGDPNEWTDTDDQLGCTQAPVVVSETGTAQPVVKVTPVLNGLQVASDHPVTVEIYRANGQKVLTRTVSGHLDLSYLDRGVYLYRVNGSPETGKVVIVH